MSTISKFPLLKLPILCMEDILIQSDSCDLMNFSLLSNKCHQIVKSLRTPWYAGLYINVTKNGTLVKIAWKQKNFGSHTVNGFWLFNCDDIGKDEQIIRSIGGCEMKTCIMNGHFFSYVDENIQISVKAGIEYLMDLFKIPVVYVNLLPDEVPETRRPLLAGFSECGDLIIRGVNQMNHDELRNILEQIKSTGTLILDIPVDYSFHCNVDSKNVDCCRSSEWVTWQHLFTWNFVTLKLVSCSLQPVGVELFVRSWFQSDETEFQYMLLKWDDPVGEFEFKDYQLMPWSDNRRSRSYKYHPDKAKNCSKGMDFEREDGMLATILIRPKLFFFCVWHTRFHDVTGLKVD